MESRRYQTFDLWRRRFRILNQYYVAPALRGDAGASDEQVAGLRALARELGRLVPKLGLISAAAVAVAAASGAALLLALTAPTERMTDWVELPSPITRWRGSGGGASTPEGPGLDG